MNAAKFIFLGLATACVMLAGILWKRADTGQNKPKPLTIFCAAVMQAPMEELAAAYERQQGIPVQVQFGGSGSLLSSLQITQADVFLAADSSYSDIAIEKGWAVDPTPVATITAGLGVQRGNPKGITSLAELVRKDLRVGIANPDAASVGKFTKVILSASELWVPVVAHAHLMTPNVTELANALKLEVIDVAVLWDTVANQYPEIDFVPASKFDQNKKMITSVVLKSSRAPDQARAFCNFLSSTEEGKRILAHHGYRLE